MAYLKVADRDAVFAAQVASPGTQVTIQVIAAAIEEAEAAALSQGQTLQEYLGNMTIADLVEQFANEQHHNGNFAVIRELSESSHDILMGDTISSDVSAMDVESQDATEEALLLSQQLTLN